MTSQARSSPCSFSRCAVASVAGCGGKGIGRGARPQLTVTGLDDRSCPSPRSRPRCSTSVTRTCASSSPASARPRASSASPTGRATSGRRRATSSPRRRASGLVDTPIAYDADRRHREPHQPGRRASRRPRSREIFEGKITNWKDVGGPDMAIGLVNRDEASGTREAFSKIVLGGAPFDPTAAVLPGTGQVRSVVAEQLERDRLHLARVRRPQRQGAVDRRRRSHGGDRRRQDLPDLARAALLHQGPAQPALEALHRLRARPTRSRKASCATPASSRSRRARSSVPDDLDRLEARPAPPAGATPERVAEGARNGSAGEGLSTISRATYVQGGGASQPVPRLRVRGRRRRRAHLPVRRVARLADLRQGRHRRVPRRAECGIPTSGRVRDPHADRRTRCWRHSAGSLSGLRWRSAPRCSSPRSRAPRSGTSCARPSSCWRASRRSSTASSAWCCCARSSPGPSEASASVCSPSG